MRSSLSWIALLLIGSACSGGGDGEVKPGCEEWYVDADGDGFGDATVPVQVCSPAEEAGRASNGDDCDDANSAIHPGADEVCDPAGVDEDCDGLANDDDDGFLGGIEIWTDADGDGFGDPDTRRGACAVGDGIRNGDDCDDSDASAFPGAAPLDDTAACMADGDGDGHGDATPAAGVIAGTDCDDSDPGAHPGAVERLGDATDQDCDGDAEWLLSDDFEIGQLDPEIWFSSSGDQRMSSLYSHSGGWSLELGGDGSVSTVTVDTTLCENMSWSYWGKRGPEAPESTDSLTLELHDGSSWIPIDVWGGGDDDEFVLRSGLITLPSAYHPALEVRLVADGEIGGDDFYVDDFRLACPGPDGDGDGIGVNDDCDDGDGDHWSDCGVCVDADGDGFGDGCDLGLDCDDGDDAIHPGRPDLSFDGIDSDCDGFDGPSLFDDFELGFPDPAVWSSVSGDFEYETTYTGGGSFSLRLGGGIGTAESVPMDASSCDSLSYTLWIKRGPEGPDPDDELVLSWFDGVDWIESFVLEGITLMDQDFIPYQGTIVDPAALRSDVKIRLQSDGSGQGSDDFYVDDLSLFCGGDADGDGFFGVLDCDDDDAAHWSDCGLCVDVDGDGYGVDCDLGVDCDDNDATQFPGQSDPPGDGDDTDCNGVDGPGLFDDFELGAPDPLVWRSINGDFTYDSTYVASGGYSLNLGGGGGVAESVRSDLSVCSDGVTFRYQAKRGPEVPETGDDLVLEWHDGTGWVELDRLAGALVTDPVFLEREGRIVGSTDALSSLQIRFTSNGSSSNNDDFYIDDLFIGCSAPDLDGDGHGSDRDCDDGDAAHWSDCGLCVDADGDDRGLGCDLGLDCDDGDNTQFSGALDVIGDGIDTDCNGFDGPGLFDDFELGAPDPFVWDLLLPGATYETTQVFAGSYSLRLAGTGSAESVAMDTTSCDMVQWSYQGRRGVQTPENGDDLVLSWFDGSTWIETDRWQGDSTYDPSFLTRIGLIQGASALWPGFRIRLAAQTSSAVTDEFLIDDLEIRCALPDGDGDGFPIDLDCDDSDPAHWDDCGVCVDADGDGFGSGCDLGRDCDDGDDAIHPGVLDPPGDGLDSDCDRLDQPGLFDDFELGVDDDLTWISVTGDHGHDSTYVYAGAYALRLGGGSEAVSRPFDVGSCTELLWSYRGKRGPDAPESGDELVLSWFDGVDWNEADRLTGRGVSDVGFRLWWGQLSDPAALSAALQIRLENTGSNSSDDVYVDDLTVICGGGGDGDGDGFPLEIDCDDSDPAHWDDCGVCVDADGDGFGSGCDLGPDCDDLDGALSPGAGDPYGDGLDTDCDGFDGEALFDDFELGHERPETWSSVTLHGQGSFGIVEDAARGQYALNLDASITVDTQPLDASACTSILWSYWGKRGPGQPEVDDDLVLSWFDGTDHVIADTFPGVASLDSTFTHRFGVITDPAALWSGLQIRLETTSTSIDDDFYVDDFAVGCTGPDLDGDGFPSALDCDEGDAAHWADCGVCVDADGDGFGSGCDLGPDCDDLDGALSPGAGDPYGDGLDTDCDGFDGEALFDDFELGIPDPAVWDTYSGSWAVVSSYAASGSYSLNLDDTNTFDSQTIDTSACPLIVWSYAVKRGPDEPGPLVDLRLYYDDGSSWILADTVEGGSSDPDFVTHQGTIVDPAALHGGFRVRLATTATLTGDDFYVDDLAVWCSSGDGDGDGFPVDLDCDDSDPAHWADCGVCVDVDGDGFGSGCDLGDDCDDLDGAVSPDAGDPYGDGLDTDCDGFDGEALFDDFELGIPDPAVWSDIDGGGSWAVVSSHAASGGYSLNLDGSIVAETVSIDTTGCPAVLWSYQGRRGPDLPEQSDDLVLSFFDGLGWRGVDVLPGGLSDPGFERRLGVIEGRAGLWPGFRMRLETTSAFTSDDFYIDDFLISCTEPDLDGDGVPPLLDCDEGDAAHWADCGACVDADGDGFGGGCDLGLDCDDLDGTVSPRAPDPVGDGLDADCSGLDGPGIFDDFGLGLRAPGIWASLVGDYSYSPSYTTSAGYSLNLGGGGATALSVPIDASTCASIVWAYEGRRGPEAPDTGDDLVLSWTNGATWIVADVLEGNRSTDASFQLRQGTITDPAALHAALQIRLQSNGSGPGTDDFYVDDLWVDCGLGDADGDGVDGGLDCDDADPAHWADCGLCVDVDGDGFGSGCDLGPDCDDNDGATYPGAGDTPGDGLDTDCSGVDGVGLFDDFELGAPGPWWASMAGDFTYDSTYTASGGYSLNLGGGDSVVQSVPMDTSTCAGIDWAYEVKRGPLAPGSGEYLSLEYHDGITWIPMDLVVGDGSNDAGFSLRSGTLTVPGALWSSFRIRFVSEGSSPGSDDFFIDDLAVVCTP